MAVVHHGFTEINLCRSYILHNVRSIFVDAMFKQFASCVYHPVFVLLNNCTNRDKNPDFCSYYRRRYQSPPKSKVLRVESRYLPRYTPFKIFPDAHFGSSICICLSGPFTRSQLFKDSLSTATVQHSSPLSCLLEAGT